MYLHALSVVLDSLASLQAVHQYLKSVIKIGSHILMIDVNRQLEKTLYIQVPKRALKIEGLFILLQYLLLGKAAMPVKRYYPVTV